MGQLTIYFDWAMYKQTVSHYQRVSSMILQTPSKIASGTLRQSHVAIGNPLAMGVSIGKSPINVSINSVSSIAIFDYRRVTTASKYHRQAFRKSSTPER